MKQKASMILQSRAYYVMLALKLALKKEIYNYIFGLMKKKRITLKCNIQMVYTINKGSNLVIWRWFDGVRIKLQN